MASNRCARGALRRDVFERQNGACARCGEVLDPIAWDVDHVVPWSIWPTTHVSGLEVLCLVCHRHKTLAENDRLAERRRVTEAGLHYCWRCGAVGADGANAVYCTLCAQVCPLPPLPSASPPPQRPVRAPVDNVGSWFQQFRYAPT
jgi:5-methylcytosine-specific restriction endonuclease McrA